MLATANTMGCLTEVLGLSLPGCATAMAVQSSKTYVARESGRQVIQLLKQGLTPRQIVDEAALHNAIVADMALGGSTNSVLHLMAIANEAGVSLNLKDFDKISKSVPYICNLKPSGKYPLSVLGEFGGIQAVLKGLEKYLKLDQMTVTGENLRSNIATVDKVVNEVLHDAEAPIRKEGGIAILFGNLAPRGAVVKQSGVKPSMHQFEGTARVFHSMEDATEAVVTDQIKPGDVIVIRYEGPKGGPGMREMHMTTSLLVGRGMDESVALITDGRFSGSSRGPCIGHISPEAAEGGPIAAVCDGDRIVIDIPNRKLELKVSDEQIEKRLKDVVHPQKVHGGALAKYAELVSSADTGAILRGSKCP